jgi:hypothetical protein
MRKYTSQILFAALILLSVPASAQFTFSYFTGFDNAAQTSGWVTYRKGSTANSNWSVATTGGYSPAKCIMHYYPVGGNVETDDWYVSPGFDFSAGGTLDSVRASFSGFGTPNNNDLVAIYLLRGSPNPTLGSSDTMLMNFVGADYVADNTWRKFGPITIPSTPGNSYIAFRYRTTINWLDVKFDNVAVSTNSGTGISETSANSNITAFPNPAREGQSIRFKLDAPAPGSYLLSIFNSVGQRVDAKEINMNDTFTADYEAGIYFYTLTKDGALAGSGKLLIE